MVEHQSKPNQEGGVSRALNGALKLGEMLTEVSQGVRSKLVAYTQVGATNQNFFYEPSSRVGK